MRARRRAMASAIVAMAWTGAFEAHALAASWTDLPDQPAEAPRSPPERDDGGKAESAASTRDVEHFRIGVLGGVGFPRPLAVEGMLKLERALGLGVEYSVMPSFTISSVETRFWALAGDARIFPFQGPFFLGLRAGHQHLAAAGSLTVAPYGTVSESLTVDTTFVNPRMGFLWTFGPGLSVGIDAGVQIPVSSSTASTLPARIRATTDVARVADALGNRVLPTVDLLRIGLLL